MGGRIGDATDAERRALELEQTTERRARLADLVERLERLSPADDDAERALVDARKVLEVADPELEREPQASAIETDAARPADGDGVELELADADGDVTVDADAADPEMREMEAERAGRAPDLSEDEPEPITEPSGLGIALGAAAEAHFYAGELGEAHTGLLAAARAHRRAGRPVAAIDACYLAIGLAPSDPELHLLLTEIYLDQGWRTLATDKLVLLSRLADLDEDPATRERLCATVGARLADEPRAQELCA
jgi:hypothetical protein